MTILEGLLLGVLQGLTEFLPISSSGHLALAEYLFGVESPGVSFEVFVHFGTALAVIVFFRKRIWAIVVAVVRWIVRKEYERRDARLAWYLLLGTVPAAVLGYLLADRVAAAFERPVLVSALLIVTGFILWATRNLPEGTGGGATSGRALLIGLAQAAAILPGISRSGATIAAGLRLKLRRAEAAEFAFLLSVPIILGATAASFIEMSVVGGVDAALAAVNATAAMASGSLPGPLPTPVPTSAIVAGTVAAFVCAIPAISVLLRAVTIGKLHRFAYYCWVVGAVGVIAFLVRG